jgi:hypothetical protein
MTDSREGWAWLDGIEVISAVAQGRRMVFDHR